MNASIEIQMSRVAGWFVGWLVTTVNCG